MDYTTTLVTTALVEKFVEAVKTIAGAAKQASDQYVKSNQPVIGSWGFAQQALLDGEYVRQLSWDADAYPWHLTKAGNIATVDDEPVAVTDEHLKATNWIVDDE